MKKTEDMTHVNYLCCTTTSQWWLLSSLVRVFPWTLHIQMECRFFLLSPILLLSKCSSLRIILRVNTLVRSGISFFFPYTMKRTIHALAGLLKFFRYVLVQSHFRNFENCKQASLFALGNAECYLVFFNTLDRSTIEGVAKGSEASSPPPRRSELIWQFT